MGVPLKPSFRCDNQCSEKSFSYWQLALVVVDEGDEAYTTNLRLKCFNKHLQAKRRTAADKRAVERGGGKDGVSSKNVENVGGKAFYACFVGYFLQERSRVKRYRELADEEKQTGVQGQ